MRMDIENKGHFFFSGTLHQCAKRNSVFTLTIIILINCTPVNKGMKSRFSLSSDGNSKRHLLSIGINDFADAGLSPLKKGKE